MSAVEASVVIPAPAQELYERLSVLENHWDLADRWVEVVSLNGGGDGGVVELRGPFGLSRTFRTTVNRLDPPRLIEGTARIGQDTVGRVSWTLAGGGDGTEVTLRAQLVTASAPDRAIWNLGGRQWLEGRLRATLERLREEYA
jgi:uncharacterized protein YndB with AHSA1/START domain